MHYLVYIVAASKSEAETIGRTLVKERLAACVNYFLCHSIYTWKGRQEAGQEWILICKTKREKYPLLEERVKRLHSYELPAIVALEIKEGEKCFLNWIDVVTENADKAGE